MWLAFLIGITLLSCVLLGQAAHRFAWIQIPQTSRRIGCIDGLRGYLALAVFFHHCIIWLYVVHGVDWNTPHGNVHTNAGQASVAVFFMITGVLFYPKMMRSLSDGEWLGHFISRIFRLAPMMWFATAAVAGIVLYQNDYQLVSPPSVIAISLFQWLSFYKMPYLFGHPHSDRIIAGVAWSLVYEWGFYLLLPGFSRLMHSFRQRVRPFYVLLSVFVYFEWLIYRHYVGPRYYILFLAGMLVAEIVKSPKTAEFLRSPMAALIGIAAAACEFVFCPTAFAVVPPILLAVFFAPVVAGNSYFGLLSRSGSIVLGEISYGIYLLHGILLYVFFNSIMFAPAPFVIPLIAPVVVAICMLTHRLIEVPAIAFGRSLSQKVSRIGFRNRWAPPASDITAPASNAPAETLS